MDSIYQLVSTKSHFQENDPQKRKANFSLYSDTTRIGMLALSGLIWFHTTSYVS